MREERKKISTVGKECRTEKGRVKGGAKNMARLHMQTAACFLSVTEKEREKCRQEASVSFQSHIYTITLKTN